MTPKPDPLSVRKLADKHWEVLIVDDNLWHPCKSESDARRIALTPVYEYEYTNRLRTDSEFANELEVLADAFENNGMRFGAGFFRDSAEQIRKHLPQ